MVSVSEQPQVSRVKLAVGLLIVALAHVGCVFLMYRARVLTHSAFWSSDLIVFAFPTLFAFGGYTFLLHAWRSSWIIAAIVAVTLTSLSCWISLFIAFNTYGT